MLLRFLDIAQCSIAHDYDTHALDDDDNGGGIDDGGIGVW